jgi:pentatricopeptide repeat protein
VHAPDTARYTPVLHELLAEMAARRLALDPVLRAAVVTLAMRGAGPDPAAAHAAYEAATRGAPPLDAPGYRHVLREFCALAGAPPPLALVFELVADARAAGHDLGADAYVAWLRAVGRRASAVRARGERPEAEQAALRTAHDRLALDATVTPRAALWAALMDAYQRAGLVRDALRVWDAVQLAGALSDAAVAVVLDTCAHAGICSFMLEAWARLVRTRYPLTRRHWNGLAEALCRLGRLERALSVVSVEMGALGDPELAPDVESVRILAKFSKAHGRYEEVEGVLRTRLPELWKEYEENME